MKRVGPLSAMLALLALATSLVAWGLSHRAIGAEARAVAPAPSQADAIDFVRDIQPIFANNCYKCHDAAKHKGGMRIDSKATAFIGGDSGEASIVPSDPDKSKLIQLVRGDDPKSFMPPKGNRLTAQQVALLVRWVKQGARWPDGVDHPSAALTHWSFRAPKPPAIPKVGDLSWVRNPIDNFVLAKLQHEGLKPSPEADRYTLIRRLSFDLIGLPPTPQEVQEFVNDRSPGAYEKLVDRLQANPHYGEKWARHWLDLGRYADSAGYGSDPLRYTTFRWRDWLINALNQNKPYDQFTIEQIAGDLLPHPTTDQLIATAFNRNSMTNTEGGTDPEEYRIEAVKDRTDTTMQVWMGLTMGCAKCHTHKYDPITNREYYQVFAFFNETEDANRADEAPTIPTPTKEQSQKIASFKSQIARAEAKLKDPAEWADAEAKWEKTRVQRQANWVVLNPAEVKAASGATLTVQPDGSILAGGPMSKTDRYTVTAHTDLRKVTAFRLEVLPDSAQPQGGVGRHPNGGFVLNEFGVTIPTRDAKPVSGRYVRVELPGKEQILSLAEVQVFHGSDDIARHGKAKQSSTDFNGPARLAIDGNTDGDFRKAKSTTHTKKSDNPWWEIDLGKGRELDKIAIWNRTDSGLQERLSHFVVLVLDEHHKPVWQTKIGPAPNPSLVLSPGNTGAVVLANASDSFHQTEGGDWSAAKAIEANEGHDRGGNRADSGWAVFPRVAQSHSAVFETAQDVGAEGVTTLVFTLDQKHPDAPIGRFRISATTAPRPVRAESEVVADALAVAPQQRNEAQRSAVFAEFLAEAAEPKAERAQIAKLKTDLEGVKPAMTAIMRELPPNKRRENHVLVKGNFLAKGAVVQPDVLAAFGPFPKDAPHNRLGLAEWILAPTNPLTARVEVNRLWAGLFGTGIVETQEDFGTQGQPPIDQPLLDWLATEFVNPTTSPGARPWDMKRMVKLIAMSATYRQASRVSPDLEQKDPNNRLYARGPSKRLAAEFVRDQALALSGLLSPKMLGPSVFPPQPDGLWQAAFNGQRTYPTSTGEDRYRRGIYTFWRRTVPYPSMAAFDAPSREVCTIRRIQTSTPLQAFVTLNDPVYVECAQALARRIIVEGGATDIERAKFALQLCLCRPPEPRQVERLVSLHQRELDRYRDDPKAAGDLATSERGPLPAGMQADDAAAWTVCANVLLNMDGVLTKR
jgi:mono/diheme cytochrome c family protein